MADVNNDGKLDVIVANGSGTVGVLLGNGDGTLKPAVTYPAPSSVYSVKVKDLNGDGFPDLVVTTQGWCCVSVLLNNRNGTFAPAVDYQSGGFDAVSVDIADVNGDGKEDLVVANACSDAQCTKSSVSVMLGNGDGTFRPAVIYSLLGQSGANSIAAADLNKDGKPDLLVANTSSNGNGILNILLNKGDGTFPLQSTAQTGGEIASLSRSRT